MEKLEATLRGAFKSFTIWFNGLMATALAAIPVATTMLPQLQGTVPDNVYKWMLLATIVGNFILRLKTNKALKDK